jgi:G3E family GTPase
MSAIPVNVVTGFLGVGKTTAVLDLLTRKDPAERWAVLVNEYGEVSIDAAILEGQGAPGVTVRDVAGGCVCCATAPYLPVALHLLLTEAKPSRLIVETTGLGHPSRLLDRLRGPDYRGRLDVRATIGLVAPDDVCQPFVLTNPIFREQVEMADVLVLNKCDAATPEQLATFRDWANDLFPPKLLIAATERGRLDPAWLDWGITPRLSMTTADNSEPDVAKQPQPSDTPISNQPVRHESPRGVRACGWRFHPDDVFDEAKLLNYLGGLHESPRLKGVARVADDERIAINRAGTSMTVVPTHYRFDSRFEIFSDSLDWATVESNLFQCLINS